MARTIVTSTIQARDLHEGHMIPALDNLYVFEVDDEPRLSAGRYGVAMGEGLILVTGHDRNGDENYLLLSPESTVEVSE